MLRFPPYKPVKITNRLIYSKRVRNYSIFYKMFDSHTGETLGEMVALPEYIIDKYRRFSPNADEYKSFFIRRLSVIKRNAGVGTQFINVAKRESCRHLCSGNIHLIAGNPCNPADNPFKFYRKLGFLFNKYSEKIQKYVDECIKNNTPVDIKKTGWQAPMYIEKCVVNQNKNIENEYIQRVKYPYLYKDL